MENNAQNSTQSSPVVLELFGIDKKWVRSENGQWIDQREIIAQLNPQSHDTVQEEILGSSSKKWWRFWKK